MDNGGNYIYCLLAKILVIFLAIPNLCFGSTYTDALLLVHSSELSYIAMDKDPFKIVRLFDQLGSPFSICKNPMESAKLFVDNFIKEWNKSHDEKLNKNKVLEYFKSNPDMVCLQENQKEVFMKFLEVLFGSQKIPPVFYVTTGLYLSYKNFGSDLNGSDIIGLMEIGLGVLFAVGGIESVVLAGVGTFMIGDGIHRLGTRFANDLDSVHRRQREGNDIASEDK